MREPLIAGSMADGIRVQHLVDAPMVSVLVPTYQHVDFIRACLESILSQVTHFQVEVLIGEDGSTDGTQVICEELAVKYPNRIRLFYGKREDVIQILGRPTGRRNLLGLITQARGRYIALCEGDDYWTDPLKLQKQVDLLEQHPDHAMCFSRAQLLKNGKLELHAIPAGIDLKNVKAEDLLATYNFVATASVVYRNPFEPPPSWFSCVPFGDLALYCMAASRGKITCMEDLTAVYRITGHGAWSKLSELHQRLSYLEFYRIISPHLTAPQRAIVATKRAEILEKMAHERYPVNPKRKWVFKKYLQLKHHA